MRIFKGILGSICLVLATALLSGCGDDDDDNGDGGFRVLEISIEDNELIVGESSVVRTEFTFDSDDVFDDGENGYIAILLPAGLVFRAGSGEIDRIVGDDHDVDADEQLCADGTSIIVFDLDDGDLDDAENPGGDADARLSFTVDSIASLNALIQARADDSNFINCSSVFRAQESAPILVR